MNIQEAKEEILHTIEAYFAKNEDGSYRIPALRQRPLLLIGPPGVGKTQIMSQAAEEAGIGLVSYTITHHTRQSAIGLPKIEQKNFGGSAYSVTEYTMSEIVASVYERIEAGYPEGILFIDEINCVSETLAPTMLQFLQAKTFGNHKLPDGWLIVAAGNPPEYNKSVREFDIVTLDRIRRLDIEPSFEAWQKYAARKLLHSAITTYLGIKPQNFCRFETTVDGRFFSTPRGWEDLSELMYAYEALHISVSREMIGEFIQHPEIARDFSNYYDLYNKYEAEYQVDETLDGKIREELCDRLKKAPFDEKFSVVNLLAAKLSALCKDLDQRADRLTALRDAFHKAETAEGEGGQERSAEALREEFNRLSDAYEDAFDETGLKLEHAFNFMEAAFGAGQEMVLFMTAITSSYYLMRFLKDYECERYYQYNRDLMFEDREAAIQKELRNLS
ncbi:MAG: MoxR family ATPase [Eubacteriales bacterium]|nr:MoxR family ATPase [Eubacteriales bacterium]